MAQAQSEHATMRVADLTEDSEPGLPILEVQALRFGPAGRALAEPLSFALERGRCLVLLGPNGVGKTSLMRTLTGALPALGGVVRWGGRLLTELTDDERASMMAFAAPRPLDEGVFTVGHLALLGRVAARGVWARATASDHERVGEALALLGLERLRDRVVAQLSDGERQLAQIARALAQDAQVLILDEPAASLDLARQASMLAMVRKLAESGKAVVLSTHDPNHALAIADQVLLWESGDRIVWGAAPGLLRADILSAAYGVAVRAYRAEDGAIVFGFKS